MASRARDPEQTSRSVIASRAKPEPARMLNANAIACPFQHDTVGAVKEVFRHADSALVALYQSILEDEEIATFVGNESTQQALVTGVLAAFFPLPQFFPTLYVMHDEDYPKAMDILQSITSSPPLEGEDWTCPQCGEKAPGNFAMCWKCQAPRDDAGNPVP